MKKILYVWHHDVSLGDSITNFHSDLSLFKEQDENCIIYTIIHPRTYNTGVCNILLNKGLIDFVFPILLDDIFNHNYTHYLKVFPKFDIVVHNRHNNEILVKKLISYFSNSVHIQTEESDFKLLSVFEYFNIKYSEFSTTLKKSYHRNYTDDIINFWLNKSNGKKTAAIFPCSTRELANINKIGIKNIVNALNEKNYHSYLVGTSAFNLYNENGVDWNSALECNYENCDNLIGNNWIKLSKLLKLVDIIISGPTGAAMIPPLFNKKCALILGGDSSIMEGCINSYTNQETIKIPCNCINYPCDINQEKLDKTKYNVCFSKKHPICLNEDINIEKLKEIL